MMITYFPFYNFCDAVALLKYCHNKLLPAVGVVTLFG